MTPSKHTPGPWRISGADGLRIKDCNAAPVTITEVRCSPLIDGDTNQANAQLMAAAPELLAACRAAVAYLENGPGGTGIDRACAQVLEAIAKATRA